jgi:hypothetical protein
VNENCSWKGVGTEIDLVDNVSVVLNAYEFSFHEAALAILCDFLIDVHF